jgi:hypothetical protein
MILFFGRKTTGKCIQIIRNFKKFPDTAKITLNGRDSISTNTIILESGHQPNFLPHAGTWKKAFLLHRIHTTLKKNGHNAVTFFFFGDQNISTSRVLSKNQVPTLNKDGLIKMGFKINESDTFKSFCSINKPTPEIWEKEITKIRLPYEDITKKPGPKNFFPGNNGTLYPRSYGTVTIWPKIRLT